MNLPVFFYLKSSILKHMILYHKIRIIAAEIWNNNSKKKQDKRKYGTIKEVFFRKEKTEFPDYFVEKVDCTMESKSIQ